MVTRRAGTVTLAELLLTLAIFAIVATAAARTLPTQIRASRLQDDLVRRAELVRTVRVILGGELRWVTAGDIERDVEAVRVRAFRGGGAVCGGADGALDIRFGGVRQPDPSKDSVLLIGRGGSTEARALTAVAGGGCAASSLRIGLSEPPDREVLYALVYEVGSYRLTGGALRYRIGGAGAQPLTEALLTGTRIDPWGTAGVRFELRVHPDSMPALAGRSFPFVVQGRNGGAE